MLSKELDGIKWNERGLVTVVVQDRNSGEVRMVAHANREAVAHTLETGLATFYSRSREALWTKGETSGNRIRVHEIWADCDGDALIYLGEPQGPSCHTGSASCFFSRLDEAAEGRGAQPTLSKLFETLKARRDAGEARSYTRTLLDGGATKIGAKIREEAAELAEALVGETDDRVVSEAADVLYHLYVGLLDRGLSPEDVVRELGRRFGRSGLDEKASRDQ